jgi:hypothetical protein
MKNTFKITGFVLLLSLIVQSCIPDSEINEDDFNFSTQNICFRNYSTDTSHRTIHILYNDSVDIIAHFSGFPVLRHKYNSGDSSKNENVSFKIFDDKNNLLLEKDTTLKNSVDYSLFTYKNINEGGSDICISIVESNKNVDADISNVRFVNYNQQYDSLYYYIDDDIYVKLAYGDMSKSFKIFKNNVLKVEGISSKGKKLILDDITNRFNNNSNYFFLITEGFDIYSTTYYNIKEYN